jgi:hypothetical protein
MIRDYLTGWSATQEIVLNQKFNQFLLSQNFSPLDAVQFINYEIPQIYKKGNQTVSCRFVDSLFLQDPEAWNRSSYDAIITDNIPLNPIACQLLSLLPEFWHIWHYIPEYQPQSATTGYNCFMNRISGERSIVFYELIKRNILEKGLVSFNCQRRHVPGHNNSDYSIDNYNWQYNQDEFTCYEVQHNQGLKLIPYNNFKEQNLTLEQCIIDSNISLIIETYVSDTHIVFSEKIFRALQLPRPWLLYCSPASVEYLKFYGFDVLDDYVDHSYDQEFNHNHRLLNILNQLETFIDRTYTEKDYQRFNQAAMHNQNLLLSFKQAWPKKFNSILDKIKKL